MIKTEDLRFVYNPGLPTESVALDHINIDIDEGEFVGIIGHTGSGKSTLIQHLNGLLKPTSGKVFIGGEDIWAQPKEIRKFRFMVGLVFQYPEYQLFEETVYKDMAFGPKNMGLSEEEIHTRVMDAARFVGLKQKHLDASPFDLSGGQKRRAAIGGVLAMDPKVLILDEPTAGLDPKGRDQILGEIKEYHKERKNTVLLVSHSMEDVARYCTKVLVLSQSGVHSYDTPENTFKNVSELKEMGLNVPMVTDIYNGLKERGLDLHGEAYTVKYAAERIYELIQEVDVK